MIVADPSAELDVLEVEIDQQLRTIVGTRVVHEPGRYWKLGEGDRICYAFLVDGAAPGSREEGEPSERGIELIRPLADLGYAGSLPATVARQALSSMVTARYVRLARCAHPEGRTLALVVAATVFLEDLDAAELKAALRELEAFTPTW